MTGRTPPTPSPAPGAPAARPGPAGGSSGSGSASALAELIRKRGTRVDDSDSGLADLAPQPAAPADKAP